MDDLKVQSWRRNCARQLISPLEVHYQMNGMKVDKACGPAAGIPPHVFSPRSAQWIITVATSFSNISTAAIFPQAWIRAKVFEIFK